MQAWFQQQAQQAQANLAAAQAQIQTLQGQVQTYQAIQHGQPGPAAVEKRITAAADPGKYKGDPASCTAWCTRMRLWLHTYCATLVTNFDQVTAVLTRLEGDAATWAANKIREGMTSGHWGTGETTVDEVEQNFLPRTHKDFVQRKFIQTKQGNQRVEPWLATMASWASQGGIENAHGKEILLANVSPAIREVLFLEGFQDPATMTKLGDAIRLIGSRLEVLHWQTRGRSGWGGGGQSHGGGPALHPGVPMEIGATSTQRPPPKGGCFKCGGPHYKSDCPQRQGGPQRGVQPQSSQPSQKAPAAYPGKQLRVLDTQGQEMSFEEAKAHFFDMYEQEVKAGKEKESS